MLAGIFPETKGAPIFLTTASGTETTVMSNELARSFNEATPRPDDCKVASNCLFLISSTDS